MVNTVRFSISFYTKKRTQKLIVPVEDCSFSSSRSSVVTKDSVVVADKISDVVDEGFVVVETFPGKIPKSMSIFLSPKKSNENEQFSPH